MEIIIQSLGFTAGETLENLVREKVNKLEAITHNAIRADVTLYIGSEGNPENNICEIRMEIPGNDPFVKKHAATFEQAIADAVDALQSQLRKVKEKMADHRS